MGTWHEADLGRPIAAPLERCAELLGVDLATARKLAANVEPYVCADGTEVWRLMQLNPTAAVWFGWCARLGLTAYARLAEKFSDPFLSCPLKAVIRYELAKQGHTLRVHGCATNVAQDLLESGKAVVQGMRFLTAKASA